MANKKSTRRSTKIVDEHLKGNKVGFCYNNGKIVLDPRQLSDDYLDTLIHELMHREMPFFSEEFVKSTATIIAKAVWKRGYRRLMR